MDPSLFCSELSRSNVDPNDTTFESPLRLKIKLYFSSANLFRSVATHIEIIKYYNNNLSRRSSSAKLLSMTFQSSSK